ncbi:MAG: hypothetical protein IJO40_05895 [Thermoguttaceae bacterium]|nr:hypothetical protein [Thermoguttaceae bacterium]
MLTRPQFVFSPPSRSHFAPFSALSLLFVVFLIFAPASNLKIYSKDVSDKPENAAKSPSSQDGAEKTSTRDRAAIFAEYQEKLRANAKICDERGMTLEAQITRSLLYKDEPYLFTIPIFKSTQNPDALPEDASNEQRSWYAALTRLQRRYANETFELAKTCAAEKRGYEAFACAQTALAIDPDNEGARRFFGYEACDGFWRTTWEIERLNKGEIETERFGWLPKDRVERYENGERYYRNRWVSETEEAEKILAGSSGWRVETEHFSILSRVSLERGVEVGRFLETYYQSWFRLYYRFVASEKQWASRFNANGASLDKKHRVILYRNREEYLRELRKHDENVDASIGWYLPNMRCIFVYEPSPDDEYEFDLFSLLAHEVTHQLFNECYLATSGRNKPVSQPGRRANFWAVEGVATYMETYSLNRANAKLGGVETYRLQQAIESFFDEKTYVPLRQYVAATRETFQTNDMPLLQRLYAQATGLTFFFVHYRDGVYRNAFIAYLYAIYQGVDQPNSLERLTGRSFEELDVEYAKFLQSIKNATNDASTL